MTAHSSERTPRRAWFDPRFAVGLLLVAASVGGVVFVVSAADSTQPVLAARDALTPGERVHCDDLVVVDVRLGSSTAEYLTAADVPADGLVVSRSVGAGELVAANAVASRSSESLSSIVISASSELATSVAEGSTVDVWAAAEKDGGTFSTPVVIVPAAIVVAINEPHSLVVDESQRSVEILVPRDRVARLLEALANEDELSLVPTTVPIGLEP